MSEGVGGLLLVGLLGLVVGAAVAGGSSSSRALVSAPPTPLPPRRLPSEFLPVEGPRRIFERFDAVRDEDRVYQGKVYEPAFTPAPWTVRAWYDSRRREHVIDFDLHRAITTEFDASEVTVAVYWGGQHDPNRSEFQHSKRPLWPDDKVHNRVVHRVQQGKDGKDLHGVFLIAVAMGAARWDFYHEPERDDGVDLLLEFEGATTTINYFKPLEKLAVIEKQYQEELARIDERIDLTDDTKMIMRGHAQRLYVDAIRGATDDEA